MYGTCTSTLGYTKSPGYTYSIVASLSPSVTCNVSDEETRNIAISDELCQNIMMLDNVEYYELSPDSPLHIFLRWVLGLYK